jgi:ribosomal protein S18 acetylase RimI-like enzyme
MKISKATLSQLDEIMTLLSEVVSEMNENGIDQWGPDHPTREMFLNHISDGTLQILSDGNSIIGFIKITNEQDKEYLDVPWEDSNGNSLVIHRLAIRPNFQARGLAKMLMEFAEKYATENNYTSIRVDTYCKNYRALQLYEKCGYEYRGIIHFPQRNLPYLCFEKILNINKNGSGTV